MVNAGGVVIVGHLLSPNLPDRLIDNLVAILGNIVVNSTHERDFVLVVIADIFEKLDLILRQHQQSDLLKRSITWMISVILVKKPSLSFGHQIHALQILSLDSITMKILQFWKMCGGV